MVSRRRVLALAGMGTATMTAGCLGDDGSTAKGDSSPVTCQNSLHWEGERDVWVESPLADADQETVKLVAPLRQKDISEKNLEIIEVSDREELLYRMPVSEHHEPATESHRYSHDDVIEYEQSLGSIPQTGWMTFAVYDISGSHIEEIDLEFRCF